MSSLETLAKVAAYLRSTLQLAYKNIREPFIMAHRHSSDSHPFSGLDWKAWGHKPFWRHKIQTSMDNDTSALDGIVCTPAQYERSLTNSSIYCLTRNETIALMVGSSIFFYYRCLNQKQPDSHPSSSHFLVCIVVCFHNCSSAFIFEFCHRPPLD